MFEIRYTAGTFLQRAISSIWSEPSNNDVQLSWFRFGGLINGYVGANVQYCVPKRNKTMPNAKVDERDAEIWRPIVKCCVWSSAWLRWNVVTKTMFSAVLASNDMRGITGDIGCVLRLQSRFQSARRLQRPLHHIL